MTGEWDVAAVARDSYDLEGKTIGTIGAGRIGQLVLQRLVPFNPKKLLYYDYQSIPAAAEKALGASRVEDLKEFLGQLGESSSFNLIFNQSTNTILQFTRRPHYQLSSSRIYSRYDQVSQSIYETTSTCPIET
jgi:formate dehydrogenase